MAKIVANKSKLYMGLYDISDHLTNIGLTLTQEAVDDVCMLADDAGTAKFMQTFTAGMKGHELSYSGYSESGTGEIGTVLANYRGDANTIVTVCPQTGAAGEPAYSAYFNALEHNEIDGTVGGMHGFSGAAAAEGTVCFRGTIMGTGAKTTTANGSIYQLGAITAGTNGLYAALHVTATAGDDTQALVVDLYSSPLANFSSSTKRLTFTTATTAITSEIKSLLTAVTDTYWRATWTITGGGASVSFTININAGIVTV